MPPITNEQTDELKARRQRRKAGQAPPAVNGSTPPGQSAGAARDLFRGLITDGARRDEEGSAATHPGSESKPAAPANTERDDRIPSESEPRPPREGEPIDELIRRVKDSAAGAAVEASSTLQQRRPKGTADLAAGAAMPRRRGARSRAIIPNSPRPSQDVRKRTTRRWQAAVLVLVLGIGVLAMTLSSVGDHRAPRVLDAATSQATLTAERTGALIGALRAATTAISRELQPLAQRVALATRTLEPRHRGTQRRAVSARATSAQHRKPAAQHRAVAQASLSPPAATQTQTSRPAAVASNTSQASVTPQTSGTNSGSQPAGPTGSAAILGPGKCSC